MKVMVLGASGLVGGAVSEGIVENFGSSSVISLSRGDCDLRSGSETQKIIRKHKPDLIVLAAANCGGIYYNISNALELLYDNVKIQMNVIESAERYGVPRLLNVASNCCYPKIVEREIIEEDLETGKFEKTNQMFSYAKVLGIKMCEAVNEVSDKFDYRSVIFSNIYGANCSQQPRAHFAEALMRKSIEAVVSGTFELNVWGSGRPKRELIHIDDVVSCIKFLISVHGDRYFSGLTQGTAHINCGSGQEYSIGEYAQILNEVVSGELHITFDANMPDGVQRKTLDSSRLKKLGFSAKISVRERLQQDFIERLAGRLGRV